MENNGLSCEIIYTVDLFYKVNKHIVNKKRKRLLIYFILVTILTIFLLLLDVFGPDNIHTTHAGFFFLAFSILSLVVLFQTRNSILKKKIIKNRESLATKSIYSFNNESMIIESEAFYSNTKIQYNYNAITNIEKIDEKILLIYFNDSRIAIIQSNNSEDIYTYVNSRIKGREI